MSFKKVPMIVNGMLTCDMMKICIYIYIHSGPTRRPPCSDLWSLQEWMVRLGMSSWNWDPVISGVITTINGLKNKWLIGVSYPLGVGYFTPFTTGFWAHLVRGRSFWSTALGALLRPPWWKLPLTDGWCGAEHPLVAQGSVLHSPLETWCLKQVAI